MQRQITAHSGPPPGEIRRLGRGDTLVLVEGAETRADWGRLVAAAADAVSRGAEVRWRWNQ